MTARNDFRTGTSNEEPASSAAAVVPHDTNDLSVATRAIYVGVAGDVKVDMLDEGTAVVFTALPVGEHPYRVTRIYATGTAATNIVALW